jgi:hypothetical protein
MIDKDRNPKWEYPSIKDVKEIDIIERFFKN